MNINLNAVAPVRHDVSGGVIATPSIRSTHRYDELSSSGVDSDWILFSPLDGDKEDVLSSNFEDDEAAEDTGEEDEDESDDDSLIDTLESSNRLNLPSGHALDDVGDDYITDRIERWRKEQARELISALHRSSDASDELMASWGVDDGLNFGSDTETDQTPQPQQHLQHHPSKRFYGDDLLQHYNQWEVNKIKKVALQLSTSLVREPLRPVGKRSDRTSLLLSLSRSANRYFSQYNDLATQPFWKQDLSSAQSSLQSLSTNSIMFGNVLGA